MVELNRSGPAGETTEAAVELCDPQLEFRSRFNEVEGAVYRGHDGMRRYHRDLAEAFSDWRSEIEAVEQIAPGVVLIANNFVATAHSGVVVELRNSISFMIGEDKVRKIHVCSNREQALKAARVDPR